MQKRPTLHQYQQLHLVLESETPYVATQGRSNSLKVFTKESLVEELRRIRSTGWIPNARPGNSGGVGNTLEDLLGIEENNLPIPNAVEWELKCQRANTTSLITLFHMEPSPRAFGFVPQVFLPFYGWHHQRAGTKYGTEELSFRQTVSGNRRSDRGFMVVVDRSQSKVLISFDANAVDPKHKEWLDSVRERVGLNELNPQPYWGFEDLRNKAGTKLLNCFYVQAETKREKGREYFRYSNIMILQQFNINGLLAGLEEGYVYVDFDARTGHNHGTKFRVRQGQFPLLYSQRIEI